MCPAGGKQKDKKCQRRKTSQDEGRDIAEKNKKSRPQRGGGFSLDLHLPSVFLVDAVCVISHDIWRYIVISCQV